MEGEMVVANMFHEIDREFMESINVLVVDDDIICLTIVAASLRKCRYSVVTVKHADDALYALRLENRDFDLVISDVHMPDMNGFELLQVITDEFDLPVVLMSADDKESMMLKGLECGAVFFILKPISPEDLKDMWQYCILRKRNKLRKGKSVVVEEINDSLVKSSSPGHQKIPRDIVLSSSSIKKKGNNGDSKKEKSKKKSSRKHKKAAEKEDNITPSKKPKIVWTASLHNKFLEAIKELGYDGAFPRKILEIMKVPGLTRENVASHLQKYRIFLQKVSDAGCEMQEGDTNLANSAIQLALQSKGRSNFSIFPQGSTGLQQYLLRKGISNTNSLAGTSKRGSSSSSKQKATPLITMSGYGQAKLITHKGESSKSTSGNANQTRSFVLEDVATQLLNAATSVDYQLTTGNLNSLHNSSGADKETDQGSNLVSVTDLFGEERHEYFEQSLARSESSLIGFTDKEFAAMLPGHVNQGASMQLQALPNNFGSFAEGSGAIVDQDFGEKRHESDRREFSSTGFTEKEFAAMLTGHIDQGASVQLPPLPIAFGDEEFAAMWSGHINQGASVQLPPLPIEFGDNEGAAMLSGHVNEGAFMQLPQLPSNVASFEGGSGTILDQNVDISMIDATNSARNSSGIGDLTSTFVSQLNVQPSDVENKDDQDGTTNFNFSDGNNQDQEAYFPWFDQTQVEQGDQTGFAAEEGSSQLHNNLPNPLEHGYDEDFWDSLLSSGPNFGDQK